MKRCALVIFAVFGLCPMAQTEIIVAPSLEWLADHCIDSGVYVVTNVAEKEGKSSVELSLTLKNGLRGQPTKQMQQGYYKVRLSAPKRPLVQKGDEFLICFQHYTTGEKRVVQTINLDNPQTAGFSVIAASCNLSVLKTKNDILKVFEERLKSHPKADPVEISDYSRDNRVALACPTELFSAVYAGSSCYLRVPDDLVEKVRTESRRQETKANNALHSDAVETEPNKPPVATSRTDPFLKLLRDGLDVKLAKHWESVSKAVDWDRLGQEAGKAADAMVREERLAYVELWKRLAAAHDYGLMCSRMYVFEWLACELLAGTHKPDKALPYADLGLGKAKACEYLLAEDLPAWAASLRSCAAAVLAGAGERRGMDVLLEAVRATLKESPNFNPVHEAMRAAWTEEALPLWAEAARDPDPRIRLVVVQQVGAIRSGRAVPVLLAILKDEDRGVRTAAAMILMQRDVKADAKAPVEFALVLMEKVRRELDGKIPSAHENAPVCLKLQQWGIPNVPWEKIEAVLTDKVRANDRDYWNAVEIAGQCLAAGRETVSLPFLTAAVSESTENLGVLVELGTAMSAAKLGIPWHAATILVSNGRPEGLDLIRRYIEIGQKNWLPAYEGLKALAGFLNRDGVSEDNRRLAFTIAAKAVERRDALFQGYFPRGLEALGEMGALVRVENRDGRLAAVDAIPIPYDQKYGSLSNTLSRKVSRPPASNARYMITEIYRAKLRSVEVAARQDKIPLPPEWLAAYAKGQRAAISALMQSPEPDLRRAAETALKDIADGRPVPNAGREDAYAE